MAINFTGYVFDDAGSAVSGATVQLLETGTSTEEASTTTNSSGLWTFSEADQDRYDIKVTSGASVRYRNWDDQISVKEIDVRNNAAATTPALTLTNLTNNAANLVGKFGGANTTRADNDEVYFTFELANSAGELTEYGRMTVVATDVTDGEEDGQFEFDVMKSGTLTKAFTIASSTAGAQSLDFNQDSITFGTGTAATDITLTFDAESADGVLTWMEDEDYFKFSDDILMNSTERLNFGDTGTYIYQSADGQLDVISDTELGITAPTVDIDASTEVNISTDLKVGDDFSLTSDSSVFNMGAGNDFTITHDGTTGATLAGNPITITSAAASTWSTSSGALTITSGAALNLNPTSGSAILLDSTISVDAGVVTGATAITSATIDATTDFTIGTTVITDDVITFTPTTSDTVTMTSAANGAFSLVTVDNAAAAANIQITADGTVDIDSAGVLTLDSGAAINIEPASGSAILLDSTISIDAGVVTGATSVTSTAFVGDITGDVTGTADTATVATTVTITDNESTNEDNAIIFTAGGDVDGGNIGLESDGTLTYNPSTGKVTATGFVGTLTGNVTGNASGTAATVTSGTQASITTVANVVEVGALNAGSITSGFTSVDVGSGGITTTGAVAGGTFDATTDFTIGDLVITDGVLTDSTGLSVAAATTVTGALTVGVDDTGYDVKLFGASAGAYILWDEDVNLLDIRGATAAGPGHLKLTTGELTVVNTDVLGKIEFQAPAETGTDAIAVAAKIEAVAQDTFSATVNATDLVFYTGHSEAATEKFRFTSQGEIGVGGANYGTDGQVLTSAGAGAAPAWEDAGGGGGAVTREGGTTTEATSTSTSSVDLLTTASLTIAATIPVLIYSNFRTSTGGSYRSRLGYKINSTEIKAPKYLDSQTNQTLQVIQVQFIGPRVTNYLRCVSSIITGDTSTDGKIDTVSSAEDGDVPNAEMTDAILRASVENASITAGADEQHVYILATS
jgi:hypothetical protein